SGQQTSYRREVCQFFDERLSAAQQIAFIHQILGRDMAEVRIFFERIEGFLTSLEDGERRTPAFSQALSEITRDRSARDRYLAFARKSASPPARARMMAVAHTLGWLSDEEKRAELVSMIDALLADNAMSLLDLDLICSLNKNGGLDDASRRPDLSASPIFKTRHAAGVACLGN